METQTSELEELKVAAADWRQKRQHNHERVPPELLERAQQAVGVFGLAAVFAATKLDRDRLRGRHRREAQEAAGPRAPAFSRMKVVAPAAASLPMVEVEMPTGVRVRLFTQTAETLQLLSSLCSVGGIR